MMLFKGVGGSGLNWPFFISEEFGKGMATPHSSSFEKCDLAGMKYYSVSIYSS